jgi:ribonuclease P protein component
MSENEKLSIIKGKKLFSEIFQTGKKVSTEYINGIYIFNKNNEDIKFQFAVAVSKKISKKAVIRNRIKRLLRESVRAYFAQNPIKIINLEYLILIWRKSSKSKYEYSFDVVRANVFRIFKELEGKAVK